MLVVDFLLFAVVFFLICKYRIMCNLFVTCMDELFTKSCEQTVHFTFTLLMHSHCMSSGWHANRRRLKPTETTKITISKSNTDPNPKLRRPIVCRPVWRGVQMTARRQRNSKWGRRFLPFFHLSTIKPHLLRYWPYSVIWLRCSLWIITTSYELTIDIKRIPHAASRKSCVNSSFSRQYLFHVNF